MRGRISLARAGRTLNEHVALIQPLESRDGTCQQISAGSAMIGRAWRLVRKARRRLLHDVGQCGIAAVSPLMTVSA